MHKQIACCVIAVVSATGCVSNDGLSGDKSLNTRLRDKYHAELMHGAYENGKPNVDRLKHLIAHHPERWTVHQWNGPSYRSSLAQLFIMRAEFDMSADEADSIQLWVKELYKTERGEQCNRP